MLRIVLIGPQGSGKGTQAKLLAEHYKIPHISTGDLLREATEKGDAIGSVIKNYLNKGKLIPTNIIIKIIEEKIKKPECKKGFILDGFPRNLDQAEALDEITEIDLVFIIDISDELAVKRISSRQNCAKCKRVYGIDIPPKKKETCDMCSVKLIVREDDKPELVKKRLEIYHDETEPLIEYYRVRKDVVNTFDGSKKADKVLKEMVNIIDER